MKKLIISIVLFAGLNAMAQIEFGKLTYRGAGCPAESSTRLDIFERKGTLLLDLNIEATSQSTLLQRKNCSVRLPIIVPRGFQIGVNTTRILGFISQANNARTSVIANMGFVGIPLAVPLKKNWTSRTTADFRLDGGLPSNEVWSRCNGQNIMLVIDVAASSFRSDVSQGSFASISELNFDFNLRRCYKK